MTSLPRRRLIATSSPRRALTRPALALLVAALAAAPAAWATPEKAARFYENALQRFEKGDLEGTVIQLKNAIQEDQKLLPAQLLMGKVLLRVGELKGAEAAFEEALRQGISRSEVALPYGQTLLLLGSNDKLLEQLKIDGLPAGLHADVLTLRGQAHLGNGNYPAAGKAFADAKAADPRSASPLIAEAPLLLRNGERDKARATATRATELAPDNPATWYTLGNTLQTLRDAKGALAAYDKSLQIAPKYADARVARASLRLILGQGKEAEVDLNALRDADQAEPRASYMRGLLAAGRGDAVEAKTNYEEAVQLLDVVPPGTLATSESLMLNGALAHYALGNTEKTREYLKNLLGVNPRHFAGQMLAANLLIETRDYAAAAPILDSLLRQDPDNAQVLYMLGSVHLARKRYAQASELFERAAAREGRNDALRELSFTQFAMGQDKLALANLEKVVAADPTDTRAVSQLSMTILSQGQTARAIQVVETALKQNPNNLAMLNFLGNVKGRAGDKRGARTAFEQVLAKDAKFRPASVNLVWLDIEEKRFDDARKRVAAMLAETKDDPALLYQLGVLEYRAGRPAEALRHWELADTVQSKDPKPGLNMLDYLVEQRQFDKALTLAKSLQAKYADHLQVQFAVARAYLAAGDPTSARLRLQEATRLAEFDPEKQVPIGRLQMAAGNLDGATYNLQKALAARPDDLGAMLLRLEIEARRGDAAKVDAALAALNAKHAGQVPVSLANGHVALSRGQFAAAQTHYRAAMDKAPSTANALLLAQALVGNREVDKAMGVLEAWSAKTPRDALTLKALAELQAQSGRWDAAQKTYERTLALEPGNADLMATYALALQRTRSPNALAMADKALKAAPDNPRAADVLGWMLVQGGKTEEGLRHLRAARLRSPDNPEIRYHLAYTLSKIGRTQEAKEEMSALISLAGKQGLPPEVAELRKSLGL